MKRIIFALFCIIAFEAKAQVADTAKNKLADTVKKDISVPPDTVPHLHSKTWALIPPAALVSYGLLSFVVTPIRNVDYYFRARIARSAPNYNSKIADYTQIAPAVLVYGLNLAGDEGKNRFIDRTALLVLSGGILTVADGLKYVTHRQRPYGNDRLSFPSGHTGAAFLTAEFMAQEYSGKSPIYGVVAYSFAVTTGVLRMYARDHWFSDVVAGAGFGILSTKAAYLIYPAIRNKLTHTDKHGRSSMIMPTYQNGTPGLSFAMQL
ncbi:MAG: superfamily protein [Mucilaginibacter sp.]|nr:superfamily protein [Mucilaginibacter sp.]